MATPSKREEIICASFHIFVEEGFDRPSMDSIASRAQVSKRTLYKHFSSKKELLEAVFETTIRNNISALIIEFNEQAPFKDQLEELIKKKLEIMLREQNMKMAKIVVSEHLKDNGILKEKIEEILKKESAALRWIDSAQKAGKLKSGQSPFEILDFLNEIIHGLVFFPVLMNKKEKISPTEIQNIMTMFLSVQGAE